MGDALSVPFIVSCLYLYEFLLDLLIAIQQNSPTKNPYIWPNLLNIANDDAPLSRLCYDDA